MSTADSWASFHSFRRRSGEPVCLFCCRRSFFRFFVLTNLHRMNNQLYSEEVGVDVRTRTELQVVRLLSVMPRKQLG